MQMFQAMRCLFVPVIVFTSLMLISPCGSAQTTTNWIGNSFTSWHDAASWSNGVPTIVDTAVINRFGRTTISWVNGIHNPNVDKLTLINWTVNLAGSTTVNDGTMSRLRVYGQTTIDGATVEVQGAPLWTNTLILQNAAQLKGGFIPLGGANRVNVGNVFLPNAFLASDVYTLEIQNDSEAASLTNKLIVNSGSRLEFTSADIGIAAGVGTWGVMEIDGAGSRIQQSSNRFHIGGSGSGSVTVSNGGSILSGPITIGVGSTGSGLFTVTGEGSTVDFSEQPSNRLVIGQDGRGEMRILNGAAFTAFDLTIAKSAGATGILTASGAGTVSNIRGSLLMGRGESQLNVLNGARTSFRGASFGDFDSASAKSEINVNGSGSTLSTSTLLLASPGTATVHVSNGGKLEVTALRVRGDAVRTSGQLSGKTEVIITGVGSSLIQSSSLGIQRIDEGGILRVRNGAQAQFFGTALYATTSAASIASPDTPSIIEVNKASLTAPLVATFAYGRLELTDANVYGDVNISNTSTMTLANEIGSNQIYGSVANRVGGTVRFIDSGIPAATRVHGDFIQDGTLELTASSILTVDGLFSGSGAIVGSSLSTLSVTGTLAPGNSPGILSIAGNLNLVDGAQLDIELGGSGIGQFDQLLIGGHLLLNNNQLNVSLVNGYTLTNGELFLIADITGDLSGKFLGLSEGASVGNFLNGELFITYTAGDGNDIALFSATAIPEPSLLLPLCHLISCLLFCPSVRSRRRAH